MSVLQSQAQAQAQAQAQSSHDRGASPLMSNNPFRNKLGSQIPPQPLARPTSTNPFLDATEASQMTVKENQETPAQSDRVNKATEAIASMNISDNQNELQKTRSRQANGGPRKPDPTSFRGYPRPPTSHRATTSEEERRRFPVHGELDIFADSFELKKPDAARQSRRNSESSVRDKPSMDPEEERRRKERKYRESKRSGSKSTKPNKKLDIIDKLDVTSIYGAGLFHHDGPFDACNPHRNRRREKYAPIQAFPKDSINMVMGGSGPLNKTMDYDKFHGRGDEAHGDYNEAAIVEEPAVDFRRVPKTDATSAYDPTARDLLHGTESAGLGTSTFLEGAPASRAAIQRRESEFDTQVVDDRPGGLSRKKSLAQKIRGGVRPRDRITSPEGRNGATSPLTPGPPTGQSDVGPNPFFRNFDNEPKKDATAITFDEQAKLTRPRAPSSPMRNELGRRNTAESVEADGSSKPSGFLGRMKSMKGRRPTRRDTNS